MENKFKDYVTSTAFSLTLSKQMIECLSQLDAQGSTWTKWTTFAALQNRGLVKRDRDANQDLPESIRNELSPVCMLTDAGRAVIPLLKLAGLYVYYNKREAGVDLPEFKVKLKEV